MKLIITLPNGEKKSHNKVSKLSIARGEVAFKKGKSPAIFKANTMTFKTIEVENDE